MYIIVTEKYIALTIVLNTIIIAVYKSIAINYYLLKFRILLQYILILRFLLFFIFLNFVFGRVFTEKFQNEIQKFNLG